MKEKIIVGLSGGRDSVALAHYLYISGKYEVIFAHVNFHLRSSESDRDEDFVRELCKTRFPGAELFVHSADTIGYARERGVSIEMAAREIRYKWFEELRSSTGATAIAVAHHRDDDIETVLLNLSRGTGGLGLVGMKAYDDSRHLWRPFLEWTRPDIDRYIERQGLPYVEDSTNEDEEIRRNYIRHTLIPAFETLNPSFRKSLSRSLAIFEKEQAFIEERVEREFEERYDPLTDSFRLPSQSENFPEVIYYRLLSRLGFNDDRIHSIMKHESSKSGQRYPIESNGRIAEVFRGTLYFAPSPLPLRPYGVLIDTRPGEIEVKIPGIGQVSLASHSASQPGQIDTNHPDGLLQLDLDRLPQNLLLRNALPEDRFRPFGMRRGSKLLFEYLKERGVPALYRPFCPVLVTKESAPLPGEGDVPHTERTMRHERIIAVLPLEIADEVRISPQTNSVLSITWSGAKPAEKTTQPPHSKTGESTDSLGALLSLLSGKS